MATAGQKQRMVLFNYMEEVSFPKRQLFRYEWRSGVFLVC